MRSLTSKPKAQKPKPVAIEQPVESGKVRCIALRHIGEEINGVPTHFAPGDTLDLDSDRVEALGHLVKIKP